MGPLARTTSNEDGGGWRGLQGRLAAQDVRHALGAAVFDELGEALQEVAQLGAQGFRAREFDLVGGAAGC